MTTPIVSESFTGIQDPFTPNHTSINPDGPAVQEITLVGRTYQVWLDEFGFYGIRSPKTGKSSCGMTGSEFDTFIVNLTWYLGYLSALEERAQ